MLAHLKIRTFTGNEDLNEKKNKKKIGFFLSGTEYQRKARFSILTLTPQYIFSILEKHTNKTLYLEEEEISQNCVLGPTFCLCPIFVLPLPPPPTFFFLSCWTNCHMGSNTCLKKLQIHKDLFA